MKRATIIATCLLNGRMASRLEDGEATVRVAFAQSFPNADFQRWNAEVREADAQLIIRNVGRASTIDVPDFIKKLGAPD